MATLNRDTVQKLAVLRAIHQWKKGPLGPLRVHKTLFYSDRACEESGQRVLFSYKRHTYGPYSDGICSALNRLQESGLIKTQYDGTAARIVSLLEPSMKDKIRKLFERSPLKSWEKEFQKSFARWGSRTHEQLVRSARDVCDSTDRRSGDEILTSSLEDPFQITGLSEDDAEELSLLVNGEFQEHMRARARILDEIDALIEHGEIPEGKDWRRDLFGASEKAAA